jgi:CheY-like chemotaxis protein
VNVSRLLLVDDEAGIRRILGSLLRSAGHEVVEAPGLTKAAAEIAAGVFDLVLTDQQMHDGDGLGVVAACREADPTLPVVMLTAFATVELAVEAMRLGAFDVLTKPFQPEQVEAVVRRATERTALLRENALLREELQRQTGDHGLIGESAPMRALREMIARVAPTHATVLITGETGTGKELVARALHASSSRPEQPFLEVNCAAFTETLSTAPQLMSAAPYRADRSRQGVRGRAPRNPVPDEAGEMSLPLQAAPPVLMNGDVVGRRDHAQRRRILVATIDLSNVKQGLSARTPTTGWPSPHPRAAAAERAGGPSGAGRHLARPATPDARTLSAALRKLSQYAFPETLRAAQPVERLDPARHRRSTRRLPELPDAPGLPPTWSLNGCRTSGRPRETLVYGAAPVARPRSRRAVSARRLGLSRSDLPKARRWAHGGPGRRGRMNLRTKGPRGSRIHTARGSGSSLSPCL